MIKKSPISDYLKKAKRGDVFSQKQLGNLLIRSDSTLQEGLFWLEKAAQSDPDAMFLLGRTYLKKKKDLQKALYWYEKAAENDHPDAIIDVGAFYLFGHGVAKDISKAIDWYRRGVQLKIPAAMHNLGFLCLQDPELYENALHFFTKAANLGYADSAYMLGVMYLQGVGVEKDPQSALEQLTLSVKLGKYYACRPIGDLYFQGVFDNGKQNPEKAIAWYLQGKEHNVLSCIEVLGDCYYFGFGVDIDYVRAAEFCKIASEQGSADAPFLLSTMYAHGQGVRKNLYQALKWMSLAEHRGNPKAPQFVRQLKALSDSNNAAAASVSVGGSTGIHLRSSYSASAEAVTAEQNARYAAEKKKHAALYAAAGAMSGHGSYTDYEMGAVISSDGEVSYVNTELGTILGADGSVSSHDAATGLTYNWSSGGLLAYNETFGATMDMRSGEISYNFDGYTIQ